MRPSGSFWRPLGPSWRFLGAAKPPQDGSKTAPRRPTTTPRWMQDGSKTTPSGNLEVSGGESWGVWGGPRRKKFPRQPKGGAGGVQARFFGGSRLPFGLRLMIFQTLLGMVLVPFWIIFEPPVNCSARFLMLRSCVVRLPSMKTPAFSKGHNQ